MDAEHARRPREPRGGAVPPGDERHRLQAGPRRRPRSPRSRPSWPRRHPADRPTAGWASASSGTWAGCTTRSATSQHDPVHRAYHHGEMTFSLVYAWSRELRAADQPRRGRARQGLAAAQDARRPLAAAGQPARLPRLHVGAPRQAAAVHGRRARPGVGVGRGPRARLVAARPPRAPRRARRWCATSTAAYVDSPALWSRDDDPARLPVDRRQRRRPQRLLVRPPRRRRRAGPGLRRQLRRGPARGTTGSACPRPGSGTRSLNTDAATYTGSGVGNLGAHRRPSRATTSASRRTPTSSCRRSRRSGSARRR